MSFNPRARVGRDRRPRTARPEPDCFNPRARVGRDPPCSASIRPTACFNPRARVGRDFLGPARRAVLVVSIHAPAWGATRCRPCPLAARACFNPRARVGRDSTGRRFPLCSNGFNPRARVGRDEMAIKTTVFSEYVSIHAPAWGATQRSAHRVAPRAGFNPRARVGRDKAAE